MKRISTKSRIKEIRRSVPALAGLAALALVGCGSQTAADAGKQAGGPVHAAPSQPVAQRTAVKQPATTTSFPERCKVAYLRTSLHIAHVAVDSAVMNTSGTVTPTLPQPVTGPLTGLPAFCDVTLTQTDAAGDAIHIEVWLPTSWNGRFQGVGGAIYSCGPYYYEMAPAIQEGYAAAATDCGVSLADRETASWALKQLRLNWPLIDDFAYAGIHDMTVVGKAVTEDYYPSPLRFSYFNGCSTGGREGMVEAQQYPADYNGIVSGAPAINWTQFIPAEIWPQLVMNESHDFMPSCKEIAFTDAAVQACASTGGVITNPSSCRWNPYALVGEVTPCGVITQQDAAVMTKIWQGPVNSRGKPLWYGLERGASLDGLAATFTANGASDGQPFPITVSWLGTWLQQDPSWNWQTLTYARFDELFQQSVSEFSKTFAANNPNLSAFEKDGGKIIIWHGLADQLIFPQGTVQYYQRVERAMGGPRQTESFARLFLAPGAVHCASGAGPAPAGPAQPLASLVSWVEKGKAPSTIPGSITNPVTGAVTDSRPLCLYPLTARFGGYGSTAAPGNYICKA
jgi:Tannase and feruloyl esterase